MLLKFGIGELRQNRFEKLKNFELLKESEKELVVEEEDRGPAKQIKVSILVVGLFTKRQPEIWGGRNNAFPTTGFHTKQ